MEEITTEQLPLAIGRLLTYATSESKVDAEYELYLQQENRKLYGYKRNGKFIGCIGIELTSLNKGEIKHIAVSPIEREHGIGNDMINFICKKHSFSVISAETDQDAVNFYKRVGFTVISLGEKYPGVERFWCVCLRKDKEH
ncbi:GNAT family N-acetyltransferase [Bacillus sp. FJAT-22090]|uniref:GNAT family N-acetyltransferase n=1 Tax=Bacillus sp. FJAT-22090 TaxID=1581038 RepID=UPI00119E7CD8|nr:GNAT family N-acetyltransferase [Bacillus sp. FJAT-22090]